MYDNPYSFVDTAENVARPIQEPESASNKELLSWYLSSPRLVRKYPERVTELRAAEGSRLFWLDMDEQIRTLQLNDRNRLDVDEQKGKKRKKKCN